MERMEHPAKLNGYRTMRLQCRVERRRADGALLQALQRTPMKSRAVSY